MSDNLLKIGTSAILANSTLLNTTSNNIANINSKGYVRQRTEFEAQILGLGVGRGTTERLINDFTLKQLRRDTSSYSYSAQYLSEANRVDALFSNPANSIATNINDLFKQIQTANNEPTVPANRGLILGSAKAMLDQFNTLSTQVLDQEKFVNQQLQLYVTQSNNYIQQIASLNKEIASYGSGNSKPVPLDLLDKRDQAILGLAEMMDIKVLDAANGEKLVFTGTGQALVMEGNDFNLIGLRGNPDTTRLELQVEWQGSVTINRDVNVKELGGKLGGLVAFREEILDPAQNQLGQLAISIADAMNTQNRLGMNLNGELGGDLFKIPAFDGQSYPGNAGSGSLTMEIEPGQGKSMPPNDFMVTVEAGNTVRIQALDVRGEVIPGSDKVVTVAGFPATISSADAGGDLYGMEITIDGAPAAGDRFMLKPLSSASRVIEMATTRPEDVALASPIRTELSVGNLGNAKVENLTVTDTRPSPATAFQTPSGLVNGPWTMTYLGGDTFEIRDNTNAVIGTAAYGSGQYQNVLSQAGLGNSGFDFSVSGVPQVGDTFTIAYNAGGFNDNRNGLALAGLQEAETTRLNALSVAGGVNYNNFNQAYGSMVSLIGERTSQARNSAEASAALLEQTNNWYESLSGVSLDEEASNLIRFQQTYAAAARILSTSQTVFDTLLSSLS